jgi:hypothetical protein
VFLDKANPEVWTLADLLSSGIEQQFPDQFS